mgnify:CR=1 FL=1
MKQIILQWGLPLVIVIAAFFVGLILDKVIHLKLTKLAERTRWKGDEIIINAFRRMFVLWSSLTGIYIAVHNITVSQSFLNIFNKVFVAVIIFSLTILFSRLAVGFVNLYTEKVRNVLPTTSIFTNLTRLLVLLIGILIILQTLNIPITPILTALGVGGLAVAIALQDTLSNLFAGLHIILSRQIRPGDYIKLDSGEEGYVIDITWRNTTVRQLPNNMVIIPNSRLASAIVTNYHLPEKEMSVPVQVGVSYDSDLEHVERVTIEVAKEVMRDVPGGVPEFEPFIRYHTFGDFSINFTVILRAREFVDQYLIKHEFIKRLHKRYKEEGIVIPFPIRTVYIQKEN